MKTTIDIKSALPGMAVGVLALFALGAGMDANPVRRYQIAGTSEHALIVDTKTGKVWRGHFPPGAGNTDGDFLKVKLSDRVDTVK